MPQSYTNLEIAKLFKKIAAAYQILGENHFKIIAYERAADSIEHLTSEVKDLWDDKKLSEIPALGQQIIAHLDELFRTGKNKHFTHVMAKIPEGVFTLLSVPGIGPKKAYKLVTLLHLKSGKTVIADLQDAAKKGHVASLDGFGEKSQEEILKNIELFKKGLIKENRIVLSEADAMVESLITFLKNNSNIYRVDALGSVRRRVSTIGDIDVAVIAKDSKKVIEYFLTYPHQKIIEKGPTGASMLLSNGRQVDLRIGDKKSYGAMLQYFTGSKNHNIALRTYALSKGMSLSEYGIKDINKQRTESSKQKAENSRHGTMSMRQKAINKSQIMSFDLEEKFYQHLGLDFIPPELREDQGEIERARLHTLPNLVLQTDIKGDLHMHSSFNLEPSHDVGVHSIDEMLDTAKDLGYEYIGISDHNPSVGNHTETEIVEIMKTRKNFYRTHAEKWNEKHKTNIGVFVMLEVDINPNGDLALPEKAFSFVDGVIVSVHSSFGLDKQTMTKRISKALAGHPKVRVLGHPTGRLLGKREGYDVDWREIYAICKQRDIALEINSSPYRMDFPDMLVKEALGYGVRFCINTDAHQKDELRQIPYGVTVARRGWAEKRDIVNTVSYNQMNEWMKVP